MRTIGIDVALTAAHKVVIQAEARMVPERYHVPAEVRRRTTRRQGQWRKDQRTEQSYERESRLRCECCSCIGWSFRALRRAHTGGTLCARHD